MASCLICQAYCLDIHKLCKDCFFKAKNVLKLPHFIDDDGYKRLKWDDSAYDFVFTEDGKPISNLMHRIVAYKYLYEPNKVKFRHDFKDYVVHHKDENKLNNHHSNLAILTQEEHEEIHGISQQLQRRQWERHEYITVHHRSTGKLFLYALICLSTLWIFGILGFIISIILAFYYYNKKK